MKENKKSRYHKNKSFCQSVKNALNGLLTVSKNERNMRTHFLSAVLACLAGFYFRLNQSEWLWLVTAIALVFICELVNTIVETVVDLVMGEQLHPLARDAKDMGAAVVIIASVFSICVGLIIFLPKVIGLF